MVYSHIWDVLLKVKIDFSFHSLPMRDIKKLPRKQRHDTLMLALEKFGPTRKAMFL